MSNTMERLQDIFRDVFDDPSITLTPATTADDIDGWDSMTHITLVVEVERQFKIKFQTAEIESLKNVGEFAKLIDERSAARAG